ncbi:unnamed protein product [Sphagnum jensenii]|jgi:hypothetical protein
MFVDDADVSFVVFVAGENCERPICTTTTRALESHQDRTRRALAGAVRPVSFSIHLFPLVSSSLRFGGNKGKNWIA